MRKTKMQHRRRREEKTDYRTRLELVKSGVIRVVIRRSSSNMLVQFVEFNVSGDKTLVSAVSNELKKYGWKAGTGNIPAAYLTGLLAGVKAKKAGIESAIVDLGLQTSTKGSRIYAALKGLLDSGIKIPCSEKILPADERIRGEHIAKNTDGKFTKYGIDVKELPKHFEEVKNKIM